MFFAGVPRLRVSEVPFTFRSLITVTESPSALSQQLAVLRRSGIVTSKRGGSTVVYELAGGDVADLMRAARRILTEMLSGRDELPAELREAEVGTR
ncbi:winged helix-turn-helix domain-containing protein [Streptomyces sp. R35]|uniref:Winged helix-turn-helix domain-containing protein n=1 Tax=Streptomyces sp. R35 TaxID=3238630 RepID=A0AB39SMX1_9ACTN